ncbi:hypothetical protein ACSSS7_000564 [Eimeria intestinalis]
MTAYIVEGRCDCARLARCQLLADRVSVILPSVRIHTEIYEPEEFKERITSHARSFPNFQEEPDLEGEALRSALERLVEANIRSLKKQRELRLKGPPIIEEAEGRTLAIIAECNKASLLPRGDRSSFVPEESWRPGFSIVPDIKVERIIEGGSRFAFWSSSDLRKKRETNRSLQLQSEEISINFLLNSALPRGAPSSCHFRLFLHNEPLCRNHLVLVPRDCMRQQHPASKIEKIFIALVVDPDCDGILPQLAKKSRKILNASWIFKDLPDNDGEDEVYRLHPDECAEPRKNSFS